MLTKLSRTTADDDPYQKCKVSQCDKTSLRLVMRSETITPVILPLIGLLMITIVILGIISIDEFVKARRSKKRLAMWHKVVLSIGLLAFLSILTLWVGEYRFEEQQRAGHQTR